jgi:hypothetical protein
MGAKWRLSMKLTKKTLFLALIFTFSKTFAETNAPGWDHFFNVYYESAYLNRAGTGAGLFVPRIGFSNPETGWEVYLVARTGIDSRTFLEQSDQIYNDNFLFMGAGIDQTKWIKGVRFSLQTGYSMDLNPKIKLGGADLRAGMLSYHEVEWIMNSLRSEVYSEAFYVRRYRNVLGSLHVRNFWPLIQTGSDRYQGIELGPVLQGVVSGDTAGFDYNRFLEGQLGVRLMFHTPIALSIHALAIRGTRFEKGSPIGAYQDARAVITGMISW